MAARSGGGLLHPLGIGEIGGVTVAAVGAGGADTVGVAGLPEAPTPPLGGAGAAVDAATEHPVRRSATRSSPVRPRFIEIDLEYQSWIADRDIDPSRSRRLVNQTDPLVWL